MSSPLEQLQRRLKVISGLHPDFQPRYSEFLDDLDAEGIPYSPREGYRSPADQAKAYAKGPSVTRAKPGQSKHQYGRAVDFDITPEYQNRFGEIAEKHGLTWGGRWNSPKDPGHVEYNEEQASPLDELGTSLTNLAAHPPGQSALPRTKTGPVAPTVIGVDPATGQPIPAGAYMPVHVPKRGAPAALPQGQSPEDKAREQDLFSSYFEQAKDARDFPTARKYATLLRDKYGWQVGNIDSDHLGGDPRDLERQFEEAKNGAPADLRYAGAQPRPPNRRLAISIANRLREFGWETGTDAQGNPYVKPGARGITEPNPWPYIKPPKGYRAPMSQGAQQFLETGEAQSPAGVAAAEVDRKRRRAENIPTGAAAWIPPWAREKLVTAAKGVVGDFIAPLISGVGELGGDAADIYQRAQNALTQAITGRKPSVRAPAFEATTSNPIKRAGDVLQERMALAQELAGMEPGFAQQVVEGASAMLPQLLTPGGAAGFGISSGLQTLGRPGATYEEAIKSGLGSAVMLKLMAAAPEAVSALGGSKSYQLLMRTAANTGLRLATHAAETGQVPDWDKMSPEQRKEQIQGLAFDFGFALVNKGPKPEPAPREQLLLPPGPRPEGPFEVSPEGVAQPPIPPNVPPPMRVDAVPQGEATALPRRWGVQTPEAFQDRARAQLGKTERGFEITAQPPVSAPKRPASEIAASESFQRFLQEKGLDPMQVSNLPEETFTQLHNEWFDREHPEGGPQGFRLVSGDYPQQERGFNIVPSSPSTRPEGEAPGPEVASPQPPVRMGFHRDTGKPLQILGETGTGFRIRNENGREYNVYKSLVREQLEPGRLIYDQTTGQAYHLMGPAGPSGVEVRTESGVYKKVHQNTIGDEPPEWRKSMVGYKSASAATEAAAEKYPDAEIKVFRSESGRWRYSWKPKEETRMQPEDIEAFTQQVQERHAPEREGEIVSQSEPTGDVTRELARRGRESEQGRRLAERQRDTDPKTGLLSQRAWGGVYDDQGNLIEEGVQHAVDRNPDRAVVRFDLNGFKYANDTLGHAAGDRILAKFATELRKVLPQAQELARAGGDELVAVVSKNQAEEAVRLGRQIAVEEGGLKITASVGHGMTDEQADAAATVHKNELRAAGQISERGQPPPVTPESLRAAVIRNTGGRDTLFGSFTSEGLRRSAGLSEDYPIDLLVKSGLVERAPDGHYQFTKEVAGEVKNVTAERIPEGTRAPRTGGEGQIPPELERDIREGNVRVTPLKSFEKKTPQEVASILTKKHSANIAPENLPAVHRDMIEGGMSAQNQLETFKSMGYDFENPLDMAGTMRGFQSETGEIPQVNVKYKTKGVVKDYRVLGRFPGGEKILVLTPDGRIQIIQSHLGETGNRNIKTGSATAQDMGKIPSIDWNDIGLKSDVHPTAADLRRVNPNARRLEDLSDDELKQHFPQVWENVHEAERYIGEEAARELADKTAEPVKSPEPWKMSTKQVEQHLDSLRPDIALKAQAIYDAWSQEGELDRWGDHPLVTGGICDEIAREISGVLTSEGYDVVDGGHDGDDHAYVIAHNGKDAFVVDIPPSVYETGGGYSWQKIPDVKFSADHVVIDSIGIKDVISPEEIKAYRAEHPDEPVPEDSPFVAKSRARLRKDLQGGLKVDTGFNVARFFYDTAVVTANDIYKTARDFGEWSAQMIKKLGENVKPHLQGIYDAITETAPTFYSPLERSLQLDMKQETMPADQLKGILRKSGVSDDEMKWTGFDSFLKNKANAGEKVTKTEALEYIAKNQVKITETHFAGEPFSREISDVIDLRTWDGLQAAGLTPDNDPGDPARIGFIDNETGDIYFSPEEADRVESPNGKAVELVRSAIRQWKEAAANAGTPKFTSLTTPGSTNHREITLSLPERQLSVEQYERALDMGEHASNEKVNYKVPLGHQYGVPEADINRIAIMRVNDRVGPNGEKDLHVDEYQDDLQNQIQKLKNEVSSLTSDRVRPTSRIVELEHLENLLPFRGKSHELAFKHILRYAAEHGYDQLTWATGEQVADRYDLRKHVDEIGFLQNDDGSYHLWIKPKNGSPSDTLAGRDLRSVSAETLSDLVGKGVAEKIIATKGISLQDIEKATGLKVGGPTDWIENGQRSRSKASITWRDGSVSGYATRDAAEKELVRHYNFDYGTDYGPVNVKNPIQILKGVDLKTGGEGKLKLYNEIIPNFLSKYTKKWGAKVESTPIGDAPYVTDISTTLPLNRDKFNQSLTVSGRYVIIDPTEQAKTGTGITLDEQGNYRKFTTKREAQEWLDQHRNQLEQRVHAVSITPEMHDSVIRSSQPLFGSQEGEPPAVRASLMKLQAQQKAKKLNPPVAEIQKVQPQAQSLADLKPEELAQFPEAAEQVQAVRESLGEQVGNEAVRHSLTPEARSNEPDMVSHSRRRLRGMLEGGTLGGGQQIIPAIYHTAVITGWEAIKAGRYVYGKAEDFAKWSKDMVDRLGDRVKPFLDDTWAKLNNAPQWYSPIENAIKLKMPNRASVEQIRGILRGGGFFSKEGEKGAEREIAGEEMKWTGLDDFLNEKEKAGQPVTKQEILDHLAENQVQVKEVELGGKSKVEWEDVPLQSGEPTAGMSLAAYAEARGVNLADLSESERASLVKDRDDLPEPMLKATGANGKTLYVVRQADDQLNRFLEGGRAQKYVIMEQPPVTELPEGWSLEPNDWVIDQAESVLDKPWRVRRRGASVALQGKKDQFATREEAEVLRARKQKDTENVGGPNWLAIGPDGKIRFNLEGFFSEKDIALRQTIQGINDSYSIDDARNIESATGIVERKLGGQKETKYAGYVTPGGSNYRELLLTLPGRATSPEGLPDTWSIEQVGSQWTVYDRDRKKVVTDRSREDAIRAATVHATRAGGQVSYTSSHWSEKNVLAHVRYNDRTVPVESIKDSIPELYKRLVAEGKTEAKILHNEEYQSDWHQKGRKKGYKKIWTKNEVEKFTVRDPKAEAKEVWDIAIDDFHDAQDTLRIKGQELKAKKKVIEDAHYEVYPREVVRTKDGRLLYTGNERLEAHRAKIAAKPEDYADFVYETPPLPREWQDAQEELRLLNKTFKDAEITEVAARQAYERAVDSPYEVDLKDGERAIDVDQGAYRTADAALEAIRSQALKGRLEGGKIPPAPFAKNWHELTFKRMLRYAAENGYDAMTWAPGSEHFRRWGSEKIQWTKNAISAVPSESLEDRIHYEYRDGDRFPYKAYIKTTPDQVGGKLLYEGLDESQVHLRAKQELSTQYERIAARPYTSEATARMDIADSGLNPDRFSFGKKRGWYVHAQEQVGGNAGGIDIEATAREKGVLKEGGAMVTTKVQLRKIVEETMDRDKDEYSPENWKTHIDKMTDKAWDRMHSEEQGQQGLMMPRKEGGEGFYDKIIADFAKKYGKKWGAKVGRISITPETMLDIRYDVLSQWSIINQKGKILISDLPSREVATEARIEAEKTLEGAVPVIDVTPEMRSSVVRIGQTLFGNAEATEPSIVIDARARVSDALSGKRMSVNPFGTMADMVIITGWDTYKLAKKFGGWSKQMIKRLGEEVKPLLNQTWAKLQAFSTEDPNEVRMGFGLGAFKKPEKVQGSIEDAWADLIGEETEPMKARQAPGRRYKASEAYAPFDLETGEIVNTREKTPFFQYLDKYAKANLLMSLSPWTHKVGSLAGNVLAEGTVRPISAGIDVVRSAVTGKPRELLWDPIGIGRAAAKTLSTQTAKDIGQILKKGYSNKQLEMYGLPNEVTGRNLVFSALINYTFRAFKAGVHPFQTYAYQRALHEQGKLLALGEQKAGLLKGSLEDRVMQMVDGIGISEGAHATMQGNALLAAADSTFQANNPLYKKIQELKQLGGDQWMFAMNRILPFAKAPSNAILTALDYTPAGALYRTTKAVKDFAELGKAFHTPEEIRNFERSWGRLMVGAGLFALGGALHHHGMMTSLGYKSGLKDDEGKRKTKVPGALIIGGHQIDIARYSPIGLVMAMGATYDELRGNSEESGSSWASDLFHAIVNKDIVEKIPLLSQLGPIGRFAESGDLPYTAKSIPYSLIPGYATGRDVLKGARDESGPVAGYAKQILHIKPAGPGAAEIRLLDKVRGKYGEPLAEEPRKRIEAENDIAKSVKADKLDEAKEKYEKYMNDGILPPGKGGQLDKLTTERIADKAHLTPLQYMVKHNQKIDLEAALDAWLDPHATEDERQQLAEIILKKELTYRDLLTGGKVPKSKADRIQTKIERAADMDILKYAQQSKAATAK